MLCWDVFRLFGSRRGDHTNWSILQPCYYGRKHSDAECLIHVKVTGFSTRYAFDFRAFDFVVVDHFAIQGLIVYEGKSRRGFPGPNVVTAKANCKGHRIARNVALRNLRMRDQRNWLVLGS